MVCGWYAGGAERERGGESGEGEAKKEAREKTEREDREEREREKRYKRGEREGERGREGAKEGGTHQLWRSVLERGEAKIRGLGHGVALQLQALQDGVGSANAHKGRYVSLYTATGCV